MQYVGEQLDGSDKGAQTHGPDSGRGGVTSNLLFTFTLEMMLYCSP
jgi:hypothetical protein